MGYPKNSGRREGCYLFKFLRKYAVQSLSRDVHHYRTTPSRLAPSSTTDTLFNFFVSRILKQDALAAAFSATSLTELEQNYSSGLVNMSLFAEIPKYFYFV